MREVIRVIPLELKLSGVRAFGNHVVRLGDPDVREIVMFGPNGSGKSTVAKMIQALMGDVPDDLQQSYLDERDPRVNKRASAELTVRNQKGDDMWNPEWPEDVVLGLEFGYDNGRSFSRYYTIFDGKRQAYRTHEEYAAMFRRPPFNIKPDDQFMFIQQGESAALVRLRPRQRYETMKQFLGLEDLEKRWQDTLDAKERALKELREAASQHDTLKDGVMRKETAAYKLREFTALSEELAKLERALADDDLLRMTKQLKRQKDDEQRLSASLRGEKGKSNSLISEAGRARDGIIRLTEEITSLTAALAVSAERHSRANEERSKVHSSVEDVEGAIGSLERISSEGLSLDSLEREAAAFREELVFLEKATLDAEGRKTILGRSLDEALIASSDARSTVQTMKGARCEAEAVLAKTGPSSEASRSLGPARLDLAAARQASFEAQSNLRRCDETLRLLEENKTAMPPGAIAARDEYVAMGTAAVVLGDVVAPPASASLADRVAIEGALGDLRWAVLVEDGRVLVNYDEYTLADFALADLACSVEAPAVAYESGLVPSQDLPLGISSLLDAVLNSVRLASDHNSATSLASKGYVAYTPDGYRYDRYGRRYSVPTSLCVGQAAYEAAIGDARAAVESAGSRLVAADAGREKAEGLVSRLEEDLRRASEAETIVANVNNALPAALAKSEQLDGECARLSAELDGLTSDLRDMAVRQAVRKRDLGDVEGKMERVKKLSDLPRLRQELADLKERESAARRAAESAREELRKQESAKDAALREKSMLEITVQRCEERLSDIAPRVVDLERDLDEKRRDIRESESQSTAVIDRWRKASRSVEMSDQEVLLLGSRLAETADAASLSERAFWTSRITDINPSVESLKDEVISTAEEDYVAAKTEFERAEQQLSEVEEAFGEAAGRESAAQGNFKKVMQETFGRVSSRFQGYLAKFGWVGYLSVEPVHGTQFDLQIYLSVYDGVEPRPLLRNRSGGETSSVAALLTLAMVKEYRRPFYIFDEIDQSLDPANVLKLGAILRQEIDRKYIIISHRLNKSHLEQGQFGIGVYRSQSDGSRTRVYRRKDGPKNVPENVPEGEPATNG